jgi:type IV pili sensor histidine kinase/response regulator
MPPFEVPVVRHSRYTLVELRPSDDQLDLMRQVIDITIPAAAHATVGDALRYVLQRSGYRLCDARADTTAELYALPLPAAHEHLGPVTLRDALQVLAGSRWNLEIDESTRQVCFVPLMEHDAAPALPSPAMPSSIDSTPLIDTDPATLPLGGRP